MKIFYREIPKEETILKVTLGILVFLLLSLTIYAIHDGNIFLFYEDETIYYGSAKIFYETSSVKAPICINEDVSPFLQTSWYGPFYHIFYGGIAKLFGFNSYYFIIIHISLILFSVYILLKIKTQFRKRILISIAFLLSPGVMSYIFTYYPESLHLFFSVILIYLLVSMSQSKDARNIKILFIVSILLFTLFRITSIFWLFGVLPFSKNKKELTIIICLIALGAVYALIYMKFFTAPAYAAGLKIFDYLFALQISDFVKYTIQNFIKNLYNIFLQSSISLFTLFTLFISSLFHSYYKKNKILISASIITIVTFLILLSFYTTNSYFFEKQTVFLFPLLIVANIISVEQETKLLKIALICLLPFSIAQTFKNIQNRRLMYQQCLKGEKMISQFEDISNLADLKKPCIIQWLYSEHDFPNRVISGIIPFRNKNGCSIQYTTNICTSSDSDSLKFQRFGKLKIDFVLSKNKLVLSNAELIKKNDYFYFYKIIKQ